MHSNIVINDAKTIPDAASKFQNFLRRYTLHVDPLKMNSYAAELFSATVAIMCFS